jgi:hypothetical protein
MQCFEAISQVPLGQNTQYSIMEIRNWADSPRKFLHFMFRPKGINQFQTQTAWYVIIKNKLTIYILIPPIVNYWLQADTAFQGN